MIYHHTGLESSGGATRVARLLVEGLHQQGLSAELSFELAEAPDSVPTAPDAVGDSLPENGVAHLHCTGDWISLLTGLSPDRKSVITLHDCELLTGGCPYPLECPDFAEQCVDPCPRNFPNSAMLKQSKLAQVERLAPVVVAPSRWLARLARTHLNRSVSVIPNGIPWPDRPASAIEARHRLGIHPAARVAMFAAHGGMAAGYKSGDSWLTLWQHLKARVPELVCFAVGGDTEERHGDLIVWPYVDRAKLGLLMSAADVLLYPTRADNHSLVILEAMSRALPVVSYAVGGVPEQIVDHGTGRLVPPGDQSAFLDAAISILSRPGVRRQMGLEAFSGGQKRFTVDRMVSGYRRIYTRFLENLTA
ncbi:glycosyltransferase [Pseudodesulfovibrio sp. JC047]|uniref:glycosyltransferase n=1 Tax=Pseudodesulfovibrio sp. JC047 TaxID=2683199 RepID=UPI001EF1CDF7|nr:glycosyltransferase [Pseudodesulfovibrio sp. JC047]